MPQNRAKTALIVGIANEDSIAWGCARALQEAGFRLAITYQNAKAEPHVRPLAETIGADIVAPLDVTRPADADALFETIGERWGSLDVLLHSIAYCPKADLHGRVVDCSAEGFATAMDISVHSFLRLIRKAEAVMPRGGTCLTVSFAGASRVVPSYNVMGPVKAALEAVVRYTAAELGEKGVSVHALSPGPMRTRAASGISGFDVMLDSATHTAPTHRLATIEEVGAFAAFLASEAAANMTGGVYPIDGGQSIMA